MILKLLNIIWGLEKYFPQSTLIAYVPPVSAWKIAELYRAGKMTSYTTMLTEIAEIYDPLYDFSIPSKITADVTLTYDGSHYNESVNRAISKTLSNDVLTFGIRTNNYSHTRLYQAYMGALAQFSDTLNLNTITKEPDSTN